MFASACGDPEKFGFKTNYNGGLFPWIRDIQPYEAGRGYVEASSFSSHSPISGFLVLIGRHQKGRPLSPLNNPRVAHTRAIYSLIGPLQFQERMTP